MESTAQRQVADFFERYPEYHYPANRDILLAGQEPRGVFYLQSGHVRQYDINRKNGIEVTTHIYHPKTFFPLAWALSGSANQNFLRTMTAVKIYVAPKKSVKEFLLKNPDILLDLSERLLQGLEGMSKRVKYLIIGDAHQKIYTELLYLAKHFGINEGNEAIISQQFTHQNIADLTGMARETVSHILEELKAQKIISDEKQHIVIHNLEKLKKLASL